MKYPTEEARRAARRATWRRNGNRQYHQYRNACLLLGARPAGRRWCSHWAELRSKLKPEQMHVLVQMSRHAHP